MYKIKKYIFIPNSYSYNIETRQPCETRDAVLRNFRVLGKFLKKLNII